jgi:tetratricopeptide (TPR) repeat protein
MFLLNIIFGMIIVASPGWTQDVIDHGPTGTTNHDYFDPKEDTQRLLSNIEYHHFLKGPVFQAKFRAGNYRGALEEVNYVLERFVNHPEALSMLVLLSRLTKNSALPIRYFEHALRLYPQYPTTYAQYGAYLVELGQIDAGIAKLQRAIEIDPKLPGAYIGLTSAFVKKGNLELARKTARQARALGYRGKLAIVFDEEASE